MNDDRELVEIEPQRWAAAVSEQVGRVIVGQKQLVERLLIGLLCGGHVLIEGVPGLAKTLAVSTLAATLRLSFRRIQFTPDLLPADVVGTPVFNMGSGEFTTRKGPIFAHIVLADEINRAPAKVQSALLEAMQERQVTIGAETFKLPDPFIVLATQNPIEHEGTYPLPEAQLDRFLLKVRVTYPPREEERRILQRMASSRPALEVDPVGGAQAILAARRRLDDVYVDARIDDYVLDLVSATRDPCAAGLEGLADLIRLGASPRAGVYLLLAAKADALLAGRDYVVPQDVKSVAHDVLRHRILLTYEAEAEAKTADDLLDAILAGVAVP
ncbi:MAG: AAA family ATPase [Planctomycetota bacterium]